MLLVGVVPLLIGLVMAFWQGTEEIRQVSGSSFAGLANETSRKLDHVLSEELSKTAKIAKNQFIIFELERRRDQEVSEELLASQRVEREAAWNAEDPLIIEPITEGELAQLLRRHYVGPTAEPGQPPPVVTRSATRAMFVTDIHGVLVASLNTQVPFSNADTAWWQGTFHNGVGKPYIENVRFDDKVGVYIFSLSLPIMDSIGYQAVGVLHRVYDAKEFFAPSINPIRFGKTGHVMLIDSEGTVINCPILPSGTKVPDDEVISLVTSPQPGWVNAPSDGHGGQGKSIIGFSSLPGISHITKDSTGRTWHAFVWQSSEELFAPVRHLLTWISVFGAVAIVLLGALGYMAAGRIITPIKRLQEATSLIGRGELKEPITIKTGDELEDLADEINRMNAQLEAAFAGLTDQVAQKTQEVQMLQQATDQILDSVSTPIFMVDGDEQVQYVNHAAREVFNLGEIDGQATSLFTLIPLDNVSQERLRNELHGLASQPSEKESVQVSAESSPRAADVRDPLDPRLTSAPSAEKKEIHVGKTIYRYEWFQLHSPSGEISQVGLILRDTTEESLRQDKLIQAEKSGSLGVLTAGIGHGLNNPLFGILGLGEAIQEEADLNTIRSYAKDIVNHGRRMAAIIKDFTGSIRSDQKERLAPVDLNQQLDEALNLAPLNRDEDIDVQRHYQTLPTITAVPDELRQAFFNIILNALQAMDSKGTLSLSSQVTDGMIQVRVTDTGKGIPKAHVSKVFDPFFTTKGQGGGSGLGLTVANRIVSKFGGRIRLESEEGKGTTCLITFPLPGSDQQEESQR